MKLPKMQEADHLEIIRVSYPHTNINLQEETLTESPFSPQLVSFESLVSLKTIKIFGEPVYFTVTKAPLIACMKLDPVFLLSHQSDMY